MATKAQKKSQKARRRAKKRQRDKQREKQLRHTSPSKRLAERLGKQKPQAWPGELQEDAAIFDDKILSGLPSQDQEHAKLVRETLDAVCGRLGEQALEALIAIPRRSAFADWRLLLRGLVDWLDQDFVSAKEAWSRLDTQRRPSRIARSLELSHRDDLSTMESGGSSAAADVDQNDVDQDIVYHAQLVRKSQLDRVALRAANAITRIPMVPNDATVNPQHIEWLRDFTSEYRLLEPDLVQALHETTIRRAFCSPYVDMFEDATKFFQGARFDRKSNLLRYMFESACGKDQEAQQYLDRYLDFDLPKNTELTETLRNAVRSQVYMLLAAKEMMPDNPNGGGMFSYFSDGPDTKLMERHYNAAVKACPANRDAWLGLEDIWQDNLDDERLKKAEREKFQEKLAAIHQRWVKALPEDISPRLALVDYLLESDRSNESKEHVDWLAGTRREDPLADAMTWKFNLLEAMRLCRRKAWLAQAPEYLDQAAESWPRWLSDDWLPYLRAAVSFRKGDAAAFDSIGPRDTTLFETASDVVDACMKLGAAQRMRVAGADLKPLRKPIDDAIENLKQLSTDTLLQLASFYWDLHRARLKYPAYRMHGTKFLGELLDRWCSKPALVIKNLDSPLVRAALLIMANEGMFNDGYEAKIPKWMTKAKTMKHPVVAAVVATAVIRRRVNWNIEKYSDLVERLKQASEKQDVFYRHHYSQLGAEMEDRLQQSEPRMFGSMLDAFDDGSLCDCYECRAARGEI